MCPDVRWKSLLLDYSKAKGFASWSRLYSCCPRTAAMQYASVSGCVCSMEVDSRVAKCVVWQFRAEKLEDGLMQLGIVPGRNVSAELWCCADRFTDV